jgi:hypothetical protein
MYNVDGQHEHFQFDSTLNDYTKHIFPRRASIRKTKVEVTLRLTVSQSVCLGIEHPFGTCDQILLPVGMLLSFSLKTQTFFLTLSLAIRITQIL